MNCSDARNILNSCFDGENHPLAQKAEEHAATCQDCRKWYDSTLRVIEVVRNVDEMPEMDISTLVMSKLPERHPASIKQDTRHQEFAWGFTGVLAGAFGLSLVLLLILFLLKGESAGIAAIQTYKQINTLAMGIAMLWNGILSALKATIEPVLAFATSGSELRTRIIGFFVVDSIVLIAAYLLWRRRRKITIILPILKLS